MGKQRIDIEYPLMTKSHNIVWEQICSTHWPEHWLADHEGEQPQQAAQSQWIVTS